MFHVLIAVAVILTVIRHTRADEESGRTELIDSTAVGRYASLTAAILLAGGASIAHRAASALQAFSPLDVPACGSVAFGLALACTGLVFTAVAAVTAQLSPSARFARGAAFGVLAAAFTLRAVGDAGSRARTSCPGSRRWGGRCRSARTPATGSGCCCCTSLRRAVLLAVAYRLLARRDVGAGLIAERPGPPQGRIGPARRHDVGVAARPRLAGAVDGRPVPLRPARSAASSTASATRSATVDRPATWWPASAAPTRWNRPSSPSRSACSAWWHRRSRSR